AVARDLETNKKQKGAYQRFLCQPEDGVHNRPEKTSLAVRNGPEVASFINDYVKSENSTIEHWDEIQQIATEDSHISTRNMAMTIVTIRNFFGEHKNLDAFMSYLLGHGVMIYASSDQLGEA